MELIDATRMVAGSTMGTEPSGRESLVVVVVVVVLRGTFRLPAPGEPVRLADAQLPLVMADTFTRDVHWFMDRLYVATVSTPYTLQGRYLVPVNFGEAGTPTCFNLCSAGATLGSIGHDDVASFDGAACRRYD